MAHNTRIRANTAAWANGSAVTQAEYDTLDQRQFESINGDQGGVWAPATEIEVGGAGLICSGPFTGLDTATFGGMSVGTIKTDVANLKTSRTVAGSAAYTISAGATAYAVGDALDLAASSLGADAGYSLSGGDTIQVPAAGTYLVTFAATVTLSGASDGQVAGLAINVAGSEVLAAATRRWSTSVGDAVRVHGSGILRITDPLVDTIQLKADHGSGTMSVSLSTNRDLITLTRVSA